MAVPSLRDDRRCPRRVFGAASQRPLQRFLRAVIESAVLPSIVNVMTTHPDRCAICAAELEPVRTLYDDRFGYPGRYGLLSCGACGHRMLDARLSPEQLEDLYTRYYPRSAFDVEAWDPPKEESRWTTWWRGFRASAFRWVPSRVRVLDIGCGFGESLGYHRNRGCVVEGVEADHNILRVAARHGLNVKVGLFDPDQYEPGSFDFVTMDQ